MPVRNIHPNFAAIIDKYTNEHAASVNSDTTDESEIQNAGNVDRFGFYHPEGIQEKEEPKEAQQKLERRLEKWREMTHNCDQLNSRWYQLFRNGEVSRKLVRRVFKGIPQQFRMRVWPLLLRVPELKRQNKLVYDKMLSCALATSVYLEQIDKDINRTFRNTTYFRPRYGSRQQSLFRILAAYSVCDVDVGYCQGMSELVGLFLTYIVEEEDVFWALCQLMGSRKHGMHGLYSRDFPGLYRLFEQHEQVLERLLPAVSKHFKTQDLPTSTYALKWFMQCFLNRLPVSLVLRLWDIYLLEGEKILIGMAFNILKMHKKQLLTMDQSQITCFLQDELVKDFRYDDDTVIESLQECLEQLRRSKVYRPPTPTYNMFPTRSFGSLGADMVWQSHPIAASKHSLPEVTAAITVNSVHSDGSLRPLRKKNSTSGKSLYNPPVREPLKVNCDPSFFPSLVTPASVLTMSAISSHSRNSQLSATPEPSLFLHENRSRLPDRVEPIASPSTDSHTSGPRIITVRSPSSSARSSSQWPPSNIKMSPSSSTGTSSPIPSSSPLLYGYATTDSKRYRAVKAAYSHSISPSPHDSTNDPRPPSHGSGVVLMSVRPRQFDRTQDYFINRLAGDLLENAQLSTVPRQRAAEGDRSDTLCDSHSRLDDTDGRLTPSTFSSTSGAEDHSQLWKYRGQPYEPCSTGQVNHSGGAIEEQKRHPTSERDRLSQLIADVNADVSSPREKSDTLVPPSSLRYILVDSESGNELPATPSSNQVASNEVSLRELHLNSCAPPEVPPHRPRSFYTPTTSPSLLPKDGKPPTGLSPSARRRRMFSVGLPPPSAPMRLAPHQCRPLPGQPN